MTKPKKKPAGRPKLYGVDRIRWTVFLSPELAAAADEHRQADQRSQSWLVAKAVEEYLEKHHADE